MLKCPVCDGEGGWSDDRGIDGYEDWDNCGACASTGRVGIRWLLSYWFWITVPVRFVEWYGDWRYPYEHKAP